VTNFLVRIDAGEPAGDDTVVLLDWFADNHRGSTVQWNSPQHPFLAGLSPSPVALDLLRLGGAVFCVDKIARRDATSDHWTRDLELSLPVSDPERWRAAGPALHEALRFLSGDRWSVTFSSAPPTEAPSPLPVATGDAVALFSGGLDSLAGAIELAESGRHLVLVGHHESSLTDHAQTELFAQLSAAYPGDQLTQRRLFLRPAPADPRQVRGLPSEKREITTRSRSLLFLSAGIAVADALGSGTPLFVPENGFIGLNVPLTAARVGSLSTRTTHPYFMDRIAALLDALDIDHPLENPFRLSTKGEALARSPRMDILRAVAPSSISCSHPEAARWPQGRMGNCGYCYPCMIRRASLHHIGLDVAAEYYKDVLTDTALLQRTDRIRGRDVRALLARLGQPARMPDILRNGRIPNGEAGMFFELYRRGRDELRAWIAAGGAPAIVSRLG
jgi:7-cyano-7-deazaguanine synthase in queuosine biosynthesis